MGKVTVGLSMSLDGFIAGPSDGPELPLGDGGERLFDWMNSGPPANCYNEYFCPPDSSRIVVDEWFENAGAIVTGRRTFDIANGWGGRHPMNVPFYVLTHHVPETVAEEETMGTFVTDGIESALSQARAAAGDKDVALCAANVAQQYLKAGLLDEIQLNVVPILLGGGVRLFDHLGAEQIKLERTRVIESPGVTHLDFRVVQED